jgi:Na+/proline symporter
MSGKKIKKISSLFYTGKESWWLIGFSMILGGGILAEPQIITFSILNGGLSDMWLLWSSVFASAAGTVFFAHLWRNVPVKTENEFILFRFSGKAAKALHIFRSLYLGGLIIPYIIAFSILANSRLISFIFDISNFQSIVLLTTILLTGTFFNNLKLKLRIDFVLFIVFVILFIIIITVLYNRIGGLSNLSEKINTGNFNYQLFPEPGTRSFNAFLVFIGFQWWSAIVLDMPDMNGQKLMASRNAKTLVKSLLLPSLLMIIFRIFAFTLPFIAIAYGFTNGVLDKELAFIALFVKGLPEWMLGLILVFFMIPFISTVQNNQNWGGSMLVENFFKHYIKKNASDEYYKKAGYAAMFYIIISASVISIFSESLLSMVKFLFAMTAGVGPVFTLRWYWWRINAWSQLSAMISALIFPIVFDLLYNNYQVFTLFITSTENYFNLDYYPVKLIILSILVCCTWLIFTFLTKPTDEQKLKTFAETVKPGGYWKNFNNGKIFFKQRSLAWLLSSINGIIVYMMFWYFLCGKYLLFTLFFIIFIALFFIVYKLINKVNSLHAETDI